MQETAGKICSFIKRKVEKSGADGVVVGVSGGLDSAVTAALCSRAIGKENVYALILPEKETIKESTLKDAREIAGMFAGRVVEVDFTDAYRALARAMPDFAEGANIPKGNLKARLRMCILYYYANKFGLLVAGTGDRSEIELGYFTKYGDGGCDFLPIGDLYKTEVRELAHFLGVPAHVADKKPSPGLWLGHTAEEELGLPYPVIDELLKSFASGEKLDDATARLRIKKEAAVKIMIMAQESDHKRALPEVCRLK